MKINAQNIVFLNNNYKLKLLQFIHGHNDWLWFECYLLPIITPIYVLTHFIFH